MAEFKKLSEVDVLETASDNATVLVEEDGEIKRVPKKEVGGGAGGYVIKLANSFWSNDGYFQFDESYDELYDVLMSGGSVWVDYTNAPEPVGPTSLSMWDATNAGAKHMLIMAWQITDIGLILIDAFTLMMGGELNIYYPNGSHNLDPAPEES